MLAMSIRIVIDFSGLVQTSGRFRLLPNHLNQGIYNVLCPRKDISWVVIPYNKELLVFYECPEVMFLASG